MNPPAPAPTEDQRTQQVRVGQAINLAWEYALEYAGSDQLDAVVAWADNAVPSVLEWINTVQARLAFTGAPVQQPQFQNPQSSASPVPAAPAAPAPAAPSGGPSIPNRSGGGDWKARKAEENWRLFMQDTTQWDDVRANKRSANAPDYRHKTQMDGKYKIGLWISEAPDFAIPTLRQWGVVA
jgi:hypothetical protein